MVYVTVEKSTRKTTGKKTNLLEKAIENRRKWLKDAKLNVRGQQQDLDNIKTKKETYIRKTDGKKVELLIAVIPTKYGDDGKVEHQEYIYNRGFFQRRT